MSNIFTIFSSGDVATSSFASLRRRIPKASVVSFAVALALAPNVVSGADAQEEQRRRAAEDIPERRDAAALRNRWAAEDAALRKSLAAEGRGPKATRPGDPVEACVTDFVHRTEGAGGPLRPVELSWPADEHRAVENTALNRWAEEAALRRALRNETQQQADKRRAEEDARLEQAEQRRAAKVTTVELRRLAEDIVFFSVYYWKDQDCEVVPGHVPGGPGCFRSAAFGIYRGVAELVGSSVGSTTTTCPKRHLPTTDWEPPIPSCSTSSSGTR